MSVHQFPARYQPGPLTDAQRETLAQEAARRERVLAAQVAVIDALRDHPLEDGGDVEVIAAVLGYLSRAHGVPADVLACAAVLSTAVDGPIH